MNFDYTVTTTKDFDEAVETVQQEIIGAGLKVLVVHNFQKSITEAGFKMSPFKMVEFCHPKFANEFLKVDIRIGLCMPCKINVYVKNNTVYVSAMRPRALEGFFPEADFGDKLEEIDDIIKDIVDKSV